MSMNDFITGLTIANVVFVLGADSENKSKYTVMFVTCMVALVIVNLF